MLMKKNKEKSTIVKIKSIISLTQSKENGKTKSKGGGYTWVG